MNEMVLGQLLQGCIVLLLIRGKVYHSGNFLVTPGYSTQTRCISKLVPCITYLLSNRIVQEIFTTLLELCIGSQQVASQLPNFTMPEPIEFSLFMIVLTGNCYCTVEWQEEAILNGKSNNQQLNYSELQTSQLCYLFINLKIYLLYENEYSQLNILVVKKALD